MATAFPSGPSWVVKFRGLDQPPGRYRQFRVRLAEVPDPAALALRCEAICRELEKHAQEPPVALIKEAQAIRAITEHQAGVLLGVAQEEKRQRNDPFLIVNLAVAHPSTKREETRAKEYRRHLRELKQFLEWAKIEDVRDLTLELVMKYIRELESEAHEPDGIRHRILWLKRAARMASTLGLPDVLSNFILVRRSPEKRRSRLTVWSLEHLCRGLIALEAKEDHRAAAALALGGLMGLRSSEIIRVRTTDLKDGILEVGARQAKNASSHRFLPVPAAVLGVLERLMAHNASEDVRRAEAAAKRKRAYVPSPYLIRSSSHRNRTSGEFEDTGFCHWLKPVLGEATGVPLQVKSLRKSFASWVSHALPVSERELMEAWMGHQTTLALPVTSRHYLAGLQAEQLRPVATAIEKAVIATRELLQSPSER